ncbi:MAG TPA: MFS transporter [Candidatus Acidoferrum sp.]|nr:MFS transporter [Candidatus Acidoferrum sp.]
MIKHQRLVLFISVLASFVAFLDGSVVTVALPAIAREVGGGLQTQQWVVDAYLITLGALILLAGSLSDVFGRRKILTFGLVGFGAASLLCALAPTSNLLIVARALQGIAGALLVPSSLALIIDAFTGEPQAKAIGTWTAWTGISFIVGPLLGGFLVDSASWRLIFAINVLPIAVTLWLMRLLDRDHHVAKNAKVDIVGALLCTLGLAGSVFALIEQARYGWASPIIFMPLAIGLGLLAIFIWYENHHPNPMLPLELFKVRNFSVGNLATTSIYAGLSVATFLIVIFLQQFGRYSALASGLALLPVTLIMFVLSPRFGSLAGKYGPRLFMGLGPIVGGCGFLLMLDADSSVTYWTQILPGMLLFGVGLSMTVAPLTGAVLGSIESRHAGIGSAVNNAIARIAGLLATAAIGVVVGSQITLAGFQNGVIAMAMLLILGGVTSAIGITNHTNHLA